MTTARVKRCFDLMTQIETLSWQRDELQNTLDESERIELEKLIREEDEDGPDDPEELEAYLAKKYAPRQ
jgi:hypothetical protein